MPNRPLRIRAVALCAALFGICVLVVPQAGRADTCWQRVIADWSDNGRIDRVYPVTCYREAISHLPEDLLSYSSAPDDIQRALLESRQPAAGRRVRSAAAPVAVQPMRPPEGGDLAVVLLSAGGGLVAAAATGYIVWRRPMRRDG